jgi:hypothetical protein
VAKGVDVGDWTRSSYWSSMKSKAEDIVYEITEYGVDPDDIGERVSEAADDSHWVFTYFASRLVSFYCSPEAYDHAREELNQFLADDLAAADVTSVDNWNRTNTLFAYFACTHDIQTLVDEALKK